MPFSRSQLPACFDLDLGPMTLVLKLDLDMVQRHEARQKHYLFAYTGGNNSHSFKTNGDSMFHITGLSPILGGLTLIERS